MTVFGDGNITEDIIGHNCTTVDIVMNYTYGIWLGIVIPISLILNPVVFYYNFKQRRSLVTFLFQLLAITDFIYTHRTIWAAWNLLKRSHDPLYYPRPGAIYRIFTCLSYVLGYSSMFITMTLGILRYVKIRFPFFALRNKRMIVMVAVTSIVIDSVWSLVVIMVANLQTNGKYIWFSPTQSVWDMPDNGDGIIELAGIFVVTVPFYIKVGAAVLFSLLTVIHLSSAKGQEIPEIKRRSIKMIVLLNVGNCIWLFVAFFNSIFVGATGRFHSTFSICKI